MVRMYISLQYVVIKLVLPAKWGCRKTAASLKNIRLDNIFTRYTSTTSIFLNKVTENVFFRINRGERERSQSADRINRR
jgi:hypothetical protein